MNTIFVERSVDPSLCSPSIRILFQRKGRLTLPHDTTQLEQYLRDDNILFYIGLYKCYERSFYGGDITMTLTNLKISAIRTYYYARRNYDNVTNLNNLDISTINQQQICIKMQ